MLASFIFLLLYASIRIIEGKDARYVGWEHARQPPETFFARMHIKHKEKRRYGRGQCHDHVGIIRCICTSNKRARMFRVHGALFSEIDITQPYYRDLHTYRCLSRGENFLMASHYVVFI